MARITRVGLNIFLDEVKALEKMLPKLYDAAEAWTAIQKDRDAYGGVDADWAYWKRANLDTELEKIRDQVSKIYDTMYDRGLVNYDGDAAGV